MKIHKKAWKTLIDDFLEWGMHAIFGDCAREPTAKFQTLLGYLPFRKPQTKTASEPLFVDNSNKSQVFGFKNT